MTSAAAYFHANPAAVLIEADEVDNEPAFIVADKHRVARESVENVANFLSVLNASKEANSMVYSPLFQSYTSLTFFAAMLAESKRLVNQIDQKVQFPRPQSLPLAHTIAAIILKCSMRY